MKEENNKKIKRIIIPVAVVLACIVIGFVGFKLYTRDYYKADQNIVDDIYSQLRYQVLTFSVEGGEVYIPTMVNPRAIIVFYPGGKVEYTAYSGLMYKLSSRGFICLLPEMKDNLAFLSIDAIEKFQAQTQEEQEHAKEMDWYIAGHSLGGVAAAQYLSSVIGNPEKTTNAGGNVGAMKGLILCASYTTEDFSDKDVRLLSIYGSNDKILNMSSYEENRVHWPSDSRELILEGGIHSYFGCYGIQEGDGEPQITNEEQLEMTVQAIDEWIGGN